MAALRSERDALRQKIDAQEAKKRQEEDVDRSAENRITELEIAMALRRASPTALPNRRIVALADDILDRRGRMLEAVEAMGGNGFAAEGVPFDLAARL